MLITSKLNYKKISNSSFTYNYICKRTMYNFFWGKTDEDQLNNYHLQNNDTLFPKNLQLLVISSKKTPRDTTPT